MSDLSHSRGFLWKITQSTGAHYATWIKSMFESSLNLNPAQPNSSAVSKKQNICDAEKDYDY